MTISNPNAELLSFCSDVVLLAEAGKLEEALKPVHKALDPAAGTASSLVPTKNGRMMSGEKGSITDAQYKRIIAKAESFGDPYNAAERKQIKALSMAEASDLYYDMTH
jgi:hypothetical protein